MPSVLAAGTPPAPPIPPGPELARVEHTRLRRRLLYGAWEQDLVQRLEKEIGYIRREAWGRPDLSANIFRSSMMQLAMLYHRSPTVRVAGENVSAELLPIVSQAGLWSLMDRVQRDTLGMREMFVRVDPAGEGALGFRPAFPDLVVAKADPEFPDRPVEIAEAVLRRKANGDQVWTWDVFDVSKPESPVYRIMDAENAHDLSADLLVRRNGQRAPVGGLIGDEYRWRFQAGGGRPFLPYVLYHAAKTGFLFDPFEAIELVEGTLTIGELWTFFKHLVKNCSWSQRWAMGVTFGEEVEGDTAEGARRGVVADPAVVLPLTPDPEFAGQPQVGQWAPTTDPSAMQEAIAMYERRLAAFAGISPSDVQRVAGDPRSGYALAITREAQREAQAKFEPQFRLGDVELLAKAAAVLNQDQSSSLPESGYEVVYATIPPSRDEQQGVIELMNAGLIDKVTAYQRLNPGVSEEAAIRALDDIRRRNAMAA